MNNLRRRCLVDEGGPEQHLYYSVGSIQSASFAAKAIVVVSSPKSATVNTSNTLSMTLIIQDHYLDGHGSEKYRDITLSLSESISVTITDTYSSKKNYSDIVITFTSKTVTIDGIEITISIARISRRLNGTGGLTYEHDLYITATVEGTSKTYIIPSASAIRINQSSAGRVTVQFK